MRWPTGLTACAIVSAGILAGCWTGEDGGGGSQPATLAKEYDEAAMDAAIAEARGSFADFCDRFASPRPGDEGFAIKVRIEDEHGVEHFWLGEIERDGERFRGTIDNEPGIVKKVRFGERYAFGADEVSDWMYRSGDGVVQGGYTTRALLETLSDEEASAIRESLGW